MQDTATLDPDVEAAIVASTAGLGTKVTIPDGLAAYARHCTTRPSRIGHGWIQVHDWHGGTKLGATNRPELIAALVAATH